MPTESLRRLRTFAADALARCLDHGTAAGVGLVPAHGLACFGLTLVPSLMRRQGAAGLEEFAAVGLVAAVDIKRRDPALRVCDGHLLLRIDKLHQQRLSPSDHKRVAMDWLGRTFKWCSVRS